MHKIGDQEGSCILGGCLLDMHPPSLCHVQVLCLDRVQCKLY